MIDLDVMDHPHSVRRCLLAICFPFLVTTLIYFSLTENYYLMATIGGILTLNILAICLFECKLADLCRAAMVNDTPPPPPPPPPRRVPNFDQYIASKIAQSDEMCVICHDTAGSRIVLPCHHAFHHDCLHEWFLRKVECPICKRDPVAVFAAVELYEEINNMRSNNYGADAAAVV